MRGFIGSLLLILCFAMPGMTQATPAPAPSPSYPANVYGIGVTYAPDSSPKVAGTALWAHKLNDVGTYAGGIADFVPTSVKHATVTSNVGAFMAQKLVDIGRATLFASTSAGISVNAGATGWAYTGGGLVQIPIKNGYNAVIGARFIKSSVTGTTGYQLLPSIGVSWGK